MGKVDDNKQQKLESLFKSAYDLFLTQGISKTSIHDIVQKAGVAKGTFYLYFKDKYEIRDRLIAKTAERLFMSAYKELEKAQIPAFEDKIIFIVDYVMDEMAKNKAVLRFISKNLSWGIFRQAITKKGPDSNSNVDSNHAATFDGSIDSNHVTASNDDVIGFFSKMTNENPQVKLKAPETMLFLIIELASSTSYSTILENDPISYQELKPYLNDSIRAIIRNHVVEPV